MKFQSFITRIVLIVFIKIFFVNNSYADELVLTEYGYIPFSEIEPSSISGHVILIQDINVYSNNPATLNVVIHQSNYGSTLQNDPHQYHRQQAMKNAAAANEQFFREQQERNNRQRQEEANKMHQLRLQWDHARKEGRKGLKVKGIVFDHDIKVNESNRKRIREADGTNDLITRSHTRIQIIIQLMSAIHFADFYEKEIREYNDSPCWQNCQKFNYRDQWNLKTVHKRGKKYREQVKKLDNDLIDIERDLKVMLSDIQMSMATNNQQIIDADATHDLFERKRVREDIIKKSFHAANYLERLAEVLEDLERNGRRWDKWDAKTYRNRAKEYRDYQHFVEKDLPAIEEDIKKQEQQNKEKQQREEEEKNKKDQEKRDQETKEKEEKERQQQDQERRDRETKENEERERDRQDKERIERETKEQEQRERQRQEEEDRRKEEDEKKDPENKNESNNEQSNNAGNSESNDGSQSQQFDGSKKPENGNSENRDFDEYSVDENEASHGLEIMNAMCNGLMSPDLEAFDNFFDSLLGKEVTGKNFAQASKGFDMDMAGEYVATSYEYRDANMQVSMDIRQLFKVGGDSNVDFNQWGTDILNLGGVNVIATTGKMTFALNGFEGKVIFSSDLHSLQNYFAGRAIEEAIYLNGENNAELPSIDPDKLPIWGLDNVAVQYAREFLSMIMDVVPLLGTSKGIIELASGRDDIAGFNINRIDAAAGLLLSVTPGAKNAAKVLGQFIATGEQIGKKGIKYVQHGMNGLFKAPEIFIAAGFKGGTRYFIAFEGRKAHIGEVIERLKPEVQEQLKNMRIPDKPLVSGGGLIFHEFLEGHIIEKHVGKSIEELIERFLKSKPNKTGDPRHFSSFNNLEEAEYFIAETLKANKKKIQKWLKNAVEPGKFELHFNQPTGKLLIENERIANDVFRSRVILIPTKDLPEGYRILTAYPIK